MRKIIRIIAEYAIFGIAGSIIFLSGSMLGSHKANLSWQSELEESKLCPCPPQREIIPKRDSIVIKAAQEWGVPEFLALAVSYVENASGDSAAVSSAGAIGIMQVMPFWGPGGKYDLSGPCVARTGPAWSWPLRDPRTLNNMELNACIGMQILRSYYISHGNWNGALRAYNGALTPSKGDWYVSRVVERLNFGSPLEEGS